MSGEEKIHPVHYNNIPLKYTHFFLITLNEKGFPSAI